MTALAIYLGASVTIFAAVMWANRGLGRGMLWEAAKVALLWPLVALWVIWELIREGRDD